eukprot:1453873-Amphidinium_carterae.1
MLSDARAPRSIRFLASRNSQQATPAQTRRHAHAHERAHARARTHARTVFFNSSSPNILVYTSTPPHQNVWSLWAVLASERSNFCASNFQATVSR